MESMQSRKSPSPQRDLRPKDMDSDDNNDGVAASYQQNMQTILDDDDNTRGPTHDEEEEEEEKQVTRLPQEEQEQEEKTPERARPVAVPRAIVPARPRPTSGPRPGAKRHAKDARNRLLRRPGETSNQARLRNMYDSGFIRKIRVISGVRQMNTKTKMLIKLMYEEMYRDVVRICLSLADHSRKTLKVRDLEYCVGLRQRMVHQAVYFSYVPKIKKEEQSKPKETAPTPAPAAHQTAKSFLLSRVQRV